jgi:hypothetical protein
MVLNHRFRCFRRGHFETSAAQLTLLERAKSRNLRRPAIVERSPCTGIPAAHPQREALWTAAAKPPLLVLLLVFGIVLSVFSQDLLFRPKVQSGSFAASL